MKAIYINAPGEVKIRFASAGGRNETFRPRPEDAYPQWLFGSCQFRGF